MQFTANSDVIFLCDYIIKNQIFTSVKLLKLGSPNSVLLA